MMEAILKQLNRQHRFSLSQSDLNGSQETLLTSIFFKKTIIPGLESFGQAAAFKKLPSLSVWYLETR